MKPIKLYFAGAIVGDRAKPEEVELGIKNKLCSFLYPKQFQTWMEVSYGLPGNIIIDSGAFSAWKSGKEVDLDAYISYAKWALAEGQKANKTVHIVNLDVIPGRVGESKNLGKFSNMSNTLILDKAAKQGLQNLRYMKKAGLRPIHVFHQGEGWEWLDRMVQETTYIGISPANDMSVISRKNWIRSVFDYLHHNRIDVDTHGFAVWIPTIIREFPWTSCDAATWRLVAAWGGVYYPQGGGFTDPRYDLPPFTIGVSEKRVGKGLGVLTPGKLKMFERDGYTFEQLQSWEERAKINIRFFLGLEAWVNKQREQTTYRPITGLDLFKEEALNENQ
jgi:hypothetical protein